MINFTSKTINVSKTTVNKNLRYVFDSLDSNKELENIAQEAYVDKYVLMRYVSYVVLGLLPFHLLAVELIDELDIEEEEAIDIVKSIRRLILAGVIKELAEIQEDSEDSYEKLSTKE